MQELQGDTDSIPGWERSPGGKVWQPTAVFLPGESLGQRSLAGHSPWGHEELDMTEVNVVTSLSRKPLNIRK